VIERMARKDVRDPGEESQGRSLDRIALGRACRLARESCCAPDVDPASAHALEELAQARARVG